MSGPPEDRLRRLPRLEPRVVARIVLAFAGALLTWYLVRVPYTDSLVRAAKPVLAAAIDTQGQQVVKVDGDELVINTGVPSPRGGGRMASLRNDGLYLAGWPVLLLWALIGATPLARLRRVWPWVLAAALGVWVTQAATLTLEVLQQVGAFRFELGLPFLGSNEERGIVLVGDYLKAVAPVVPFAFYLPVFFVRGRRPADAAPASAAPQPADVPRNAPCPCGSGLKYKRCHGAT